MEKILLINDSGNFGGVSSIFRNIIARCDLTKYDVDILFASNGPMYEEVSKLGYKMNYIQELTTLTPVKELALLFKLIFKINKEIKIKGYDKVYSSGFLSCMACGILSYRYKKVKFIWHEHNMPRTKIRKLIVKAMAKNIRKILVVSQAIKDNYPVDDDKVVVLHNGIVIDKKNYLNCKSDKIINLAIVSRIDLGKGHLEVIEAFNKVKEPNVKLYIIGSATSKESQVIEEKIKMECDKNSNIILLGFTKNVDKYYKEMDVVIQASTLWDSLPTVLLEAMNYNCALIGTKIGGIPEIIDNRNGYIIEVDNIVDELSKLIIKITDKKQLLKMQKESKRVLIEKFDLDRQIERMNLVWKE